MNTVLENKTIQTTAETQAQLQHNAMIKERYRRLQNAEADQFGANTEEVRNETNYTVRASVFAPEKPVFSAPTVDAPATKQTPQVTEFVHTRVDNPVFTTEKFNTVSDITSETAIAATPVATQAAVEMPVQIYAPTTSTAVSTETQYSLSRMAKMMMAAFAALVVVMLTIIGINSQIIQRKTVELNNLEMQRDELIMENQEIQRRIADAKSEETIRAFVESRGMN